MTELTLKYGCNPHQQPSRIYMENGGELPIEILSGRAGYINLLDALNAYQLARELDEATGLPAAASFKHVSPAGAALGIELTALDRAALRVSEKTELSPLACAYVRARGADRLSSFGDFAAVSRTMDAATAQILAKEVSDGVIAPDYDKDALEILRAKRGGAYTVIKIDAGYVPAEFEKKQVYGITFEQKRNDAHIDSGILKNIVTKRNELTESAARDLVLSLITLKYTQSNSVCYALDGQTIGVGAGQQSRIHCTRLAAQKAELWWLRRHEKALALPFKKELKRPDRDNATVNYLMSDECDALLANGAWQSVFTERPAPISMEEREKWLSGLTGVSLGSDAFFPFSDNIDRAARVGVKYIAQPGGSMRDDAVIDACDRHGILMAMTGLRLFHH